VPARAYPVEVLAAHAGAVAVEVHANRAAAPALWTTAVLIRERRQRGVIDGPDGHPHLPSTAGLLAAYGALSAAMLPHELHDRRP
jgi:hypothetical protein